MHRYIFLFCVYIDDLLVKLSESNVGCYVGLNFVGALAYADDIVLIAPSPSAMRKLLTVCDVYASSYDIVFNANKSKYLVITPSCQRALYKDMGESVFNIGNKPVEFVTTFTHLGHIIRSNLDDADDILCRRNFFVGQVNNVLCFFNKLDTFIKLRLFEAYCSSMYGCELWALDNHAINDFCIAWRKALRRIMNIPYNSHTFVLPLITDSVPIFDEMCRRSAKFISSCCLSDSAVVRTIARHGLLARFNSCIGKNALLCCQRFGWSVTDLRDGNVPLYRSFFKEHAIALLSEQQLYSAVVLLDALQIRDGYSVFVAEDFFLSRSEIEYIINFVSTS